MLILFSDQDFLNGEIFINISENWISFLPVGNDVRGIRAAGHGVPGVLRNQPRQEQYFPSILVYPYPL